MAMSSSRHHSLWHVNLPAPFGPVSVRMAGSLVSTSFRPAGCTWICEDNRGTARLRQFLFVHPFVQHPSSSIGQTDSTRTRPKPVMDAACCCASQNRTSAGLDPETGSLSSHISRPPAVAPQAEFTPAQLFHNACTARRGQFHANACADGYFLSVRTPAGLLLPPANLSLRAAPRPREQRSRPGFLRCLRWAQSSGRTAERPFGCTVTTCSIQQRPNAAPSTLVQSAHAGTSLSRAGCLFQGKPACRVPAPAGPNRQPAAQFSTPGDEPGVRRLQPGNR
jgi:hypothetical protein